jgi:hypothetical protein
MDPVSAIDRIERSFEFELPLSYRTYLSENESDVDESVEIDALEEWPRGPIATVDRVYCSKTILNNDAARASCDPEQMMLIIGHNGFGGYLYLCWDRQRLGKIFFREPFQDGRYYLVAESFDDFLVRKRPIVYDDEA